MNTYMVMCILEDDSYMEFILTAGDQRNADTLADGYITGACGIQAGSRNNPVRTHIVLPIIDSIAA